MGGYAKGWTDVVQIDWDKVDSGAPTPLEPGVYGGFIIKADPKKTKTGKPSIGIEIEIDTASDGEKLERKGKVFDTMTLTEDGAFKLKQLCEAVDLMDYLEGKMTYDDIVELVKELTGPGSVGPAQHSYLPGPQPQRRLQVHPRRQR